MVGGAEVGACTPGCVRWGGKWLLSLMIEKNNKSFSNSLCFPVVKNDKSLSYSVSVSPITYKPLSSRLTSSTPPPPTPAELAGALDHSLFPTSIFLAMSLRPCSQSFSPSSSQPSPSIHLPPWVFLPLSFRLPHSTAGGRPNYSSQHLLSYFCLCFLPHVSPTCTHL